MTLTQKKITGLVAAVILSASTLQAYDWKQAKKNLTPKEQGIVSAAMFTAIGDLPKLKKAFNDGLDAGLTINELKELVLQLYAYTGFPRCLNAAATLETVVNERKQNSKKDEIGPEAIEIPAGVDKYELGKKNLEVLANAKLPSHPTAFIQGTDTFLKEHLFADIFARGVLSNAQRELGTVSALAALGNVVPQLKAHMGLAMNVGVTSAQIEGALAILKINLSRKKAVTGLQALYEVLNAQKQNP